jgi:spore coat protein U-like protein
MKTTFPLMSTDIAVMLTTLWIGVGNVVTTMMEQWKRCSSTDCSIFVFFKANLVQVIGKGKGIPITCHAGTQGKERYNYSFLTSAQYGGSWSTPRIGCFTPKKQLQYQLYRRLGGPQVWSRWVWRRENLSSTRVCLPKHPAHSESLHQIYYPCPLWCKVQTFLLLPEEYATAVVKYTKLKF